MNKRRFPIVNIALLTVIAVVFIVVNKDKTVPDERNCSYIIDDKVIELVDGRSDLEIAEGAASRLITDFIISEGGPDLNGDGTADSAVFLKQSSGGSGTFYYIAVAFKTGDGYSGSNAVFLGDRIEPLDIYFDGNIIAVIYKDRRDGESFSEKPSVEAVQRLEVAGGKLRKISEK